MKSVLKAMVAAVWVVALQGVGETVAVWKLGANQSNVANTMNLTTPKYDLTFVGSSAAGDAPFVGVPRNLGDTSAFLDDARNEVSLRASSGYLMSTELAPVLDMTNSWTVEGWYLRKTNPSGGDFLYVFGTRNNADGWLLAMRQRGEKLQYYLYAQNAVTKESFFGPAVDLDGTNQWRHLALTYDHDATDVAGKGVWEFFVDGVSYGVFTNNQACTTAINKKAFFIGGREHGGVQTSFGADYWRVSAGVLSSDQFLKAPVDSGTTDPSARTLAFWRLDADGVTRNLAGTSCDLSATVAPTKDSRESINFSYDTQAKASPNQAIDVISNAGAVLANRGSARLDEFNAYLQAENDLGLQLERDREFTIEGWVYREKNTSGGARGWTMPFGTRHQGAGFGLHYGHMHQRFGLYVDTTNGVAVTDTWFPDCPTEVWENTWKHIALTHDPDGFGDKDVWELFVDGVSMGCITSDLPASVGCNRKEFWVGSRPGYFQGAGCYDCYRVCARVLAPSEFLNAADHAQSVADGDVLAFWPLDAENEGIYLNGRDLKGSYSFTKMTSFDGYVDVSTNSAVNFIPNPDMTINLHGDPGFNGGSFAFPEISRANYLAADLSLSGHLTLTNDFTVEGWLRLDSKPGGWHILFSTGAYTNPRWCLGVRKYADGVKYFMFTVTDSGSFSIPDNSCFDAVVTDDVLGVWRHHAFVYRANEGHGVFELFIDGVSCGKQANAYAIPEGGIDVSNKRLLIGGRPTANSTSIIGGVDLVRVSAAALTPDQFLNSSQSAYTPPVTTGPTVSYWKLKRNGTSIDLASQEDSRYDFAACDGGLVAPAIGVKLDLYRSFTVEGWIQRTGGQDAEEAIAATAVDNEFGWKLLMLTRDDGQFIRIVATDGARNVVVDGLFDVTDMDFANSRRHVALTYTWARDAVGAWELFVDGDSVGRVRSRYYPEAASGATSFSLGTAYGLGAFKGTMDKWRVTAGVLAPEGLLYAQMPAGLVIMIR